MSHDPTHAPTQQPTHLAPIVRSGLAMIPAVGLGTWPLKGDVCEAAVSAALDAGYRHIDTAAMYGNEAEVGRAINASTLRRSDIFLTTKVWRDNIATGNLQRSAEASLEALDQPYVDLLLIHWPNANIPLAESIAALCEVKRGGLAHHVGVSNFPTKLLAEAQHLTTEPLVCNQIEYHPHLDQSKVLAACKSSGMAMSAYCPLGRGDTGSVLSEPVIVEIATAHKKSAAQVVLRWHHQQGVVTIPKSATPTRIRENFDIFDFTLADSDMTRITALTRANQRIVKPAEAPRWD